MPQADPVEAKRSQFETWMKSKMPKSQRIEVADMQRTTSGASHETYFMTVRWSEDGTEHEERMVARWPPLVPLFHEYDLDRQFRLMKALETSPIPVPKMHWYEGDEGLGGPFFAMGRVDGTVPADMPPYHTAGIFFDASPEERRQLWQEMIETIAEIHSLDWKGMGLDFLRGSCGGVEALDQEIDFWHELLLFSGAKVLVVDEAFAWLRANRFPPTRLSLCWGDARPANFVFDDHDVVGVLDWEQAFVGPPESDIFWFSMLDEVSCQTFGISPLAGAMNMSEVLDYYQSITGQEIENPLFHEIFTAVKSAVGLFQVGKNFEAAGVTDFPTGFFTDNPSTKRLDRLLSA